MPSINFPALKLMVPMQSVLELIGWKPASIEYGERRGPCPIHGSRDPASRSFAVKGDGFYCHSCKANGDQLRLYATVRKLPLYAACHELSELLVFPMPYQPRLRTRRTPRNREEER